ncbi:hypothetical protein [Compostibacter hankyongensis]|uniref:Preprotein translocase subunit SecB n=1 Tax=Compostibacter hankyongensis TaxID=1007089 RepID=A0ABP8FNU5_9BACT
MEAQLSPLVLLDFAIINSIFKFIAPPENVEVQKLVSEYLIDIDFAIIQEEDGARVFVKSAINQGETESPGYSIFAEGVAILELSKTATLTEKDRKALLQYSAVSIALNSLRGFISSLTANAPFGKYILPSIDVNNLFQQKAKAGQNLPQNKRGSKRSSRSTNS